MGAHTRSEESRTARRGPGLRAGYLSICGVIAEGVCTLLSRTHASRMPGRGCRTGPARRLARVSLSVCPNRACSVLVSRPGEGAGCRASSGTLATLRTDRPGFLRTAWLCWSRRLAAARHWGGLTASIGPVVRQLGAACLGCSSRARRNLAAANGRGLKSPSIHGVHFTVDCPASKGRSVFHTSSATGNTVTESHHLAPAWGPMP